jgi:stress-induced morphogen
MPPRGSEVYLHCIISNSCFVCRSAVSCAGTSQAWQAHPRLPWKTSSGKRYFPILLWAHSIRSRESQVTEALKPTLLEISNDSAAHSHHRAMEGNTSKETHFRLVHAASMKPWLTIFSLNIVSDAFKSKLQPARHRIVYALLKEELDRPGGIHALQLRTKTPEEEAKQASRAGN